MNIKKLSAVLFMSALFAIPAKAALISPDIIFGSGNTNGGFTVITNGDLELGIRAKRRYSPNDQIGVGIVQDAAGNYLFDSSTATAVIPSNMSFWSFDWSINSDVADGSDALNTYSYLISYDTDPSAAVSLQTYDPLSALSTGYYLGNNASGNGGATFETGGDEDFSTVNVAQNSVNMGFLMGGPLGSGQFQVSLSAFQNGLEVASTSINVFVDTTPTAASAPATALLFSVALGGIVLYRRKKHVQV